MVWFISSNVSVGNPIIKEKAGVMPCFFAFKLALTVSSQRMPFCINAKILFEPDSAPNFKVSAPLAFSISICSSVNLLKVSTRVPEVYHFIFNPDLTMPSHILCDLSLSI